MENKVVAIIQARLTSTRFPNKIIQELDGKTLIQHLYNRLKKSTEIDEIVLAVPNDKYNKKIKNYLKNIKYYFGSEEDVLDRYYKAAKKYRASTIVRICGDCPLVDPKVVDNIISKFKKKKVDYASNTIEPTFPDGLDVEVFSFKTLKQAWSKAKLYSEREHVTPYMLTNNKIKKYNYKFRFNLSSIRLTIDEKVDYLLLKKLYSKFKNKKNFGIENIYNLFKKNKKLFQINSQIIRNEGSKIGKGQKLWRRAQNVIPGGNMLLSKRPEMYAPNQWPSYYQRAKGCFVWDVENKKYIDLSLMSVGTNILGYSNKQVDNAVINAIKKSNMSSLNCYEEIYLSEKLIDMHKHFDMVRYARTGGEANAIAIRLARAASGRDKIAICGYHGWHDWYLSANLNSKNNEGVLKDHLLPGLSTSGVPKNLKNTIYPFKFNDFETLTKICSQNQIAAIKMEIFRNIPPNKNFLKKVRELATKKNIVLIFDECTSGFRESYGGLHLKYKILPDVCILGKALGNGFPITAVLGKKEIMQNAQTSFISSTFWTERSGYVAALKTLEIMENIKSWRIISTQGKKLKRMIKSIASKNKLDINITGLESCPSYSLKSENWMKYKTFITQELLNKQILGANTTYISISHNDTILKKYIENLDWIFENVYKCENKIDDINSLLKGPVCHAGFKRLN